MFEHHNETVYGATFKGVGSDQFDLLEKCFSLSINVFEKQNKDTAIPVYISSHSSESVVVLNVYRGHLSYVSDFENYATKFRYDICDRFFICYEKLDKHQLSCDAETNVTFKGGLFNTKGFERGT